MIVRGINFASRIVIQVLIGLQSSMFGRLVNVSHMVILRYSSSIEGFGLDCFDWSVI